MTIRDLFEQTCIQGNVEIQQMQNDEMVTLYEDYEINEVKAEPYMDKEIAYIYSSYYEITSRNCISVLVIEIEED